jgi:heptosyltransferase II
MNLGKLRTLDRVIGSFLCRMLGRWVRRRPVPPEFHRLLLIQLWGLGESVLTLPLMAALREKYPDAEIHVLATQRNSPVYQGQPFIDHLHVIAPSGAAIATFTLRNARRYDVAIDCEEYLNVSALIAFGVARFRVGYGHGHRSALFHQTVQYDDTQHVALTFLALGKPFGIHKAPERLVPLAYDRAAEDQVECLLRAANVDASRVLVGLGCGVAESARTRIWPGRRFARLVDSLIEQFAVTPVFVGTASEKDMVQQIIDGLQHRDKVVNAVGKTSHQSLFALLARCSLFIGNDSGPMHVAAAQGVPTIGLFGCNLPARFGPYGPGNIGLRKTDRPPCINVHRGEVPDCRFREGTVCVEFISVDDVMAQSRQLLTRAQL